MHEVGENAEEAEAFNSPRSALGTIMGLPRTWACGLVVGLLIAVVGGRIMESLLFGAEPSDPLVQVCATSLVFIVAPAANLAPTRYAMRVDPCIALRAE